MRKNFFIATATVLILACRLFSIQQNHDSQLASIAIIGDIDLTSFAGKQVSKLVVSKLPIAIISTGDNAYSPEGLNSFGSSQYESYINEGKFFPTLGNHDYYLGPDLEMEHFPYIANASSYSQRIGNIDFFFLDSVKAVSSEESNANQYQWLEEIASRSDAKYKIVVFHYPPYTSGTHHGPSKQLRWNFDELGITAVISGHEHLYERLFSKGTTFLISGLGGKSLYRCGVPINESEFCNAEQPGALFLYETGDGLFGQFIDVENRVVDQFEISQ